MAYPVVYAGSRQFNYDERSVTVADTTYLEVHLTNGQVLDLEDIVFSQFNTHTFVYVRDDGWVYTLPLSSVLYIKEY